MEIVDHEAMVNGEEECKIIDLSNESDEGMEEKTLTETISEIPPFLNLEALVKQSVIYEYTTPKVLRYGASKVAAICGLHEYCDLQVDFLEHVYQGLDEMLYSDAKLLHLELVTKDDELRDLITQTGASVALELNQVLQFTRETVQSTTQIEMEAISKRVEKLVSKATKEQALTVDQGNEIRRSLHGRLATNLGNRNEALAIQTYEKERGCVVRHNNDQTYCLSFQRISDDTNVAEMNQAMHRGLNPEDEQCFFRLFGRIDGLTEALIVDKSGEWQMELILLEVKNRVHAFRDPPPIYDQIQTTVYMKMLDCKQADLIQCMTRDKAKILVSRIALDSPPLNTGQAWKDVLVPRMYQYTAAVYKVRSQPLLRLALMNASEPEQRKMILDLCPFLE